MRLFRIRSRNTLSDETESVLIGGCAQNCMRYSARDVEDNAAPTFGLCLDHVCTSFISTCVYLPACGINSAFAPL